MASPEISQEESLPEEITPDLGVSKAPKGIHFHETRPDQRPPVQLKSRQGELYKEAFERMTDQAVGTDSKHLESAWIGTISGEKAARPLQEATLRIIGRNPLMKEVARRLRREFLPPRKR